MTYKIIRISLSGNLPTSLNELLIISFYANIIEVDLFNKAKCMSIAQV